MQRRGLTSQTYPACAHVPLPASFTGTSSSSTSRCCMQSLLPVLTSVSVEVLCCISQSWHAARGPSSS
jgi:hypothetical protein